MNLKNKIKEHMIHKQSLQYEKRLAEWKRPYSEWILEKEKEVFTMQEDYQIPVFTFGQLKQLSSKELLKIKKSKYILFCHEEGSLSKYAVGIIGNAFEKNKDAVLLYGDEDVWEKGRDREKVWYKPEWSPITYQSFFYFGSAVAFRSEEFLWSYQQGIRMEELCGNVLEKCGAFGRKETVQKVIHVPYVLFHAKRDGLYEEYKSWKYESFGVKKPAEEKNFVSIIIPSKNNRQILGRCIDSLIATIPAPDCEIIVVDNGTQEAEREAIREMLSLKLIRITYVYEPMEFNFSKMCNLGVSKAKGNIIVLLNDDLTAINNGWFEKMCSYTRLPYVGAVGIKLYYPDSHKIQHAGITNILPGPVHKLQYLTDDKDYYYGRNTKDHNVIGVTGACLMVRRNIWEEAGGLCEQLEVAFNDVDFCYTLWEMGYYNVVVEEAFLYHHESLSRGRDEEESKLRRLVRERSLLYKRHPKLEGKDPFYPKGLNQRWLDTTIRPALGTEDVEGRGNVLKLLEKGMPKNVITDKCLSLAVELVKEEKETIVCDGYGVVIGSNNACFRRSLLLLKEQECFRIPVTDCYRPDIEENMPDQICVAMSGFYVKIPKELLPSGEYRIGMLAEDKTSRLKLANWSNRYITITGNEDES